MDSLQSILGDRVPVEQPPEVKIIKDYVQTEFHAAVEVIVRERDIVIGVPSAALANTLRLRGPEIKQLCRTDKRLTFRIG